VTAAVTTDPGTAARAERGSQATALQHPQRAGPRDRHSAEEIVASLPLLPVWSSRSPGRNAQRQRGAERILDWLSEFPGDGWQARWLLSGADNGTGWIEEAAAGTGDIPAVRREVVTDGFAVLLLRQVVLPGYQLLGRYRTTSLFREARRVFSPGLFDRIGQAGRTTGHSAVQQAVAESCLLKMMLHTGRDLGELTQEDLIGYHDWGRRTSGKIPPGLHAAWDLLRDAGVLTTQLPLRRVVGRGQLTASQLVDRYQLQCHPARDAFVAYPDERRPGLDYNSLQGLASRLVGTFWADIGQHHPGIGSLRLPAQVAEDWKQRLAFRTDRKGNQVRRTNRLGVLVSVRAFYLDIALRALEDPAGSGGRCPARSARATSAASPRRRNRSRPACTSGSANGCPAFPTCWPPPNHTTPTRQNCWPPRKQPPSDRPSSTPGAATGASAATRTGPGGGCSTGSR